MPKVRHDRFTRSWSAFIRTEDPCIQFKMTAASLMRGFSRWQFMVLGRKTQVFNTVNQKNNFYGTLGCLKRGNQ